MGTFRLLTTRRFAPYFTTQFAGAFNDSLIRRAVEMLITFEGLSGRIPASTAIFLLLGLFMLPFFTFSAWGGYLADTKSKDKVVQVIKMAEVGIVIIGAVGLTAHSLAICTAAVFGLGIHSAFFGPVKFSLPPQHLHEDELVAGNGLIEAGTNVAILLGTILGSLLIVATHGELWVSILAGTASAIGLLASFQIPPAPATVVSGSKPLVRLGTIALIKKLNSDPRQFRIAMGISWFWTLGAIIISLFSLITKDLLLAPEWVVSLFFAVFSLGVGAGSVYCNRLLKGEVASTWVPLSSLVMGASLFSFYLLLVTKPVGMVTAMYFVSPHGLGILASLFILAAAAGLYIVPLYGLLQHSSNAAERSQIIAANNIMNAFLMVIGSVALMALFSLGGTIGTALLVLSGLSVVVAIYTTLLLPDALLKSVLRTLFKILYRAKIAGLEHFASVGPRALIVANHLSFLDAVMLTTFLPGRLSFAVNTEIANLWWMRPVQALFDIIPLDPRSPMAVRVLINKVKENRNVVIFPEGRITITGSLMKVYVGPGVIADKADAPIIPVRLDGFQYSIFARRASGLPRKFFPRLSMTVCEPVNLAIDQQLKGRVRREEIALKLYDLMTGLMFSTNQRGPTLLHELHKTMALRGSNAQAIRDPLSGSMSLQGLYKRSFIFSKALPRALENEERVGLLLPTGLPMLTLLFSLQWRRQMPALLNYSHSVMQMAATCKVSALKYVLTSRKFTEVAKLGKHIERLTADGVQLLYLEDIREGLTTMQKLAKAFQFYWEHWTNREDIIPGAFKDGAVVLFTSGSEGTPKGVVLSHENLLSNIDQVVSLVPITTGDKVFNALPMFHSFGLTGGTLMPLLKGLPLMLYPSPLHYRVIPEMVYDEASTILFGTPTFLAGYAKKANVYDFFNVRYIFSGAERLPDTVRDAYQDRFGIRIFEGYGATETSPIIAVNTPFQFRRGTVGRLLPGMRYRLEPVPGYDEGGRLFVAGPNIMKGYLRIEKPGELQSLGTEWYDTGDIVSVDAQGFFTIRGRAKRFAKIGGEMVSLTAIEQLLESEWPKATHAVVAVPDARKGEKLIVVTTEKSVTREAISGVLRKGGLPDLAIPREFLIRPSLPLLGSGKVDVQQLSTEVRVTIVDIAE